jgi:carboxymethylenebutenolidase
MCFELDSVPPVPVIAGAAVSHEDLALEAADGAEFAAFAALPDQPSTVGIVILADVRGLYRFYEELALRFAERGYASVAIDYFGRTAGVKKRDEDFPFREHVDQTTQEQVQADIGAAVAHLRELGCRSLAAASGHGLAGAIGFYGRPGDVVPRVGEIEAPILALQAGADAHISADDNAEFERALSAAGVEHELVAYDGAPHSFFDRSNDEFADASEDAWRRVLDFIDRHS